jgi:hypothetical protein
MALPQQLVQSAICLALLIVPSAAVLAQEGGIAVECVDLARAPDKVTFELDVNRQAATGAFPINWAWFTRGFILFGYSAQINGDYQTMQSYTLDRATAMLEVCDFAAGGEHACDRLPCSTVGSGLTLPLTRSQSFPGMLELPRRRL